jgi:hypothetical protein
MGIITCSKCRESKPEEAFYRQSANPSGRANQCKDCRKAHFREFNRRPEERAKKREYNVAYMAANRDQIKRQKQEYNAKFGRESRRRNKPWLTEAAREGMRRYRAKPESKVKNAARTAVYRAIKSGDLVKSRCCERCGSADRVQGHHHRGYGGTSQTDVVWLCSACHIAADRKQAA